MSPTVVVVAWTRRRWCRGCCRPAAWSRWSGRRRPGRGSRSGRSRRWWRRPARWRCGRRCGRRSRPGTHAGGGVGRLDRAADQPDVGQRRERQRRPGSGSSGRCSAARSRSPTSTGMPWPSRAASRLADSAVAFWAAALSAVALEWPTLTVASWPPPGMTVGQHVEGGQVDDVAVGRRGVLPGGDVLLVGAGLCRREPRGGQDGRNDERKRLRAHGGVLRMGDGVPGATRPPACATCGDNEALTTPVMPAGRYPRGSNDPNGW